MTTSAAATAFAKEFAARPENGPGWLHRLHQDAFGIFQARGFPTTKEEDWRYTKLDALTRTAFQAPPTQAATALFHADLQPYLLLEPSTIRLVFVNGRYVPELSSKPLVRDAVQVQSLQASLRGSSESEENMLKEHFGKRAGMTGRPFYALNSAFLQDGAWIRLGSSAHLDHPIHLLFVSTAEQQPFAAHPRVVVHAERGSRATLVESYVAVKEGRYLNNSVTEFRLGPDAHIDHYRLQDESQAAYHIGQVDVQLDRDSVFRSFTLSFGAKLARNKIRVNYRGKNAEAHLNGLYMVSDKQHVDNQTHVDHSIPHCRSFQNFRGVLDDEATGVFSGGVLVRQDAQKTQADQANKNLLLSKQARADAKPQLEIHADDVKCAHGVAIGQLDADAVFYLRSRGIGAHAARSILTRAFAGAVTEQIRVAPLRCRVDRMLSTRLSDDNYRLEPDDRTLVESA